MEAHYSGSNLLHVIATEDEMETLREVVSSPTYGTSLAWAGIPIYRPGICPCFGPGGTQFDGAVHTDE